MEDVDQSIASQNAIVVAIGNKLKNLRTGIAASKKNGENTLLTVPPIVKGITDKLDIIKKMLAEAKNIKKDWATANTQLAELGRQKVATSKALEQKDKQIAEMNERLQNNQATHLEDHDKLSKQQAGLAAANQANLAAKDRADASLAALQQQSTAATQQQQAALQAALEGKTAAEEAQRRAEQEVAATKAALGTSQQHANAMQSHMNKLGDLKKHQATLTAALNALNAEIDAANDDMSSLDDAHVAHLGAIKGELERLDNELGTIIASEPPSPPPAAGSGNSEEMKNRIPNQLSMSPPDSNVLPSQQIPLLNEGAESVRDPTFDELDAMRLQQPDKFRSLPSDVKQRYMTDKRNRQFQENEDRLSNLRGGKGKGRQRGGYIAVKKTRSKSSSSSGRRGTRRRSSSRSSSTRRRRHRGSTSSTRSSRR